MARKMNGDAGQGDPDVGMRDEKRGGRRNGRSPRRTGWSSDEQAFYSGVLREEDDALDEPGTPIDLDKLDTGRARFFHDEEAGFGATGFSRGGRQLLRQSRGRRERREPRER